MIAEKCTPISLDEFRAGMRRLAGAVNLITSVCEGERHGMIATAVTSLTADPPSLLICVNQKAATHAAIARSGCFCVNVLKRSHQSLSTLFSGGGTGAGRFEGRKWETLATGAPVLPDAIVSFDCHVSEQITHGTHTIFLGAIVGTKMSERTDPLLYAFGLYAHLEEHESLGAPFHAVDYWSM